MYLFNMFMGCRIAKNHAVLKNTANGVYLKPEDGGVLHNGKELATEVKLEHQDRCDKSTRRLSRIAVCIYYFIKSNELNQQYTSSSHPSTSDHFNLC